MVTRFNHFKESLSTRIQPAGIGRALDDRILLAQAALVTLVVALINWGLLIVVMLVFGETTIVWIDVALLASNTVVAIGFIRTGNLPFLASFAIWSSALTVFTIHVLLGGYAWSGSYLLWGISNVVIAALWLSVRATTAMASLYLIAAVVFAFLEPTFQQWRGVRPDPNLALVNALQILVTTVLVIAPMTVLLRERIFDERSRSRSLMLNILPETIADRLETRPGLIADDHEECTVLFADLVGFTAHSRQISAQRLVSELNQIFVAFDHIVVAAGGEKIKTMGDGYMAVFGIPDPLPEHIQRACEAGLDLITEMESLNGDLGTDFKIRVGIATGSAVAGVIGETKFSYDVWSDTVTLASRLERAAEPNSVYVGEDVAGGLGATFETRLVGEVDLKGRGPTPTFELLRSSQRHQVE